MKKTVPPVEPIVVECDLPHPPTLVWRALTEKELLGTWLLPNDIRPEVGARFSFECTDPPRPHSVNCEVLDVQPNRTLRWRQTEDAGREGSEQSVTSVVSIDLTDNATGGTHLRLVHDQFEVAPRSAIVVPLRAVRVRRARAKHVIVCQLRRAA